MKSLLFKYDIAWLLNKIEQGDSPKFFFFWGQSNPYNELVGRFCFSQWYECPFIVDGTSYRTAEHWMMAQKALLFGDTEIYNKIISCEKPSEAKSLGREVKGFKDEIWNTHKFEIVVRGNIHKFSQYPEFAAYLLKTEDRILVEASPVDTIWGIGLSRESKDIENVRAWRGQNLLGFALMETRDYLKSYPTS